MKLQKKSTTLLRNHLSTESPLTAACFGVPGPVLNNTCRTTNIPWTIEGDKLAEFLHIPQVRLLNDLEATGYGLQLLRPDEIEDLNPDAPSPPPDGTRALLAAGTGLGESLILWTGKGLPDLSIRRRPCRLCSQQRSRN